MDTDDAEPRVSYVLPVYNEAARVEPLLEQLLFAADRIERRSEFVFADDGSTDATLELLEQARADEPRIRIECGEAHRGKGGAVRRGMLAATGAYRITMDADLSTDLEALPRLIAELECGYDVVLGSRNLPGAELAARQPFAREMLGRGFRRLSAACFAPEVTDFTCGFKGFRAPAARAVFARTAVDGWAFDVEVVVAARSLGYRVGQIPVRWSHTGDSKVRVVDAVPRSLFDLGRIALRRGAGRYR